MQTEIAYSTNGMFRVVEQNYWFTIQRKHVMGWKRGRIFATRSREAAINTLEALARPN